MSNSLELLLGRKDNYPAWHVADLVSESFCAVHKNQICTYPDVKNDTLDENDQLRHPLPLDNQSDRLLNPRFDLSDLDRLPREVLDNLLVQVDLETLTGFRTINQKALQIVDSLREYRAILQHSPLLLRAALATGVGSAFSCQDVFDTLVTATCEVCHDFAGYIYLPTCSRVCFLCFSEGDKFFPLLAPEIKLSYDIGPASLADVPRMLSLPFYDPGNRHMERLVLYDSEAARQAAIDHFGSVEAMQRHADSDSLRRERRRLHEEQVERWDRYRTCRDQPPSPELLPRGKPNHPRRFMAVVRASCLNPKTKQNFRGFHCLGCRDETSRIRALHWRRMYSEDTFDEHMQEWGPIEAEHYPDPYGGSIRTAYRHQNVVARVP